MKKSDFKIGQFVSHHFTAPSIDDIRVGIIESIDTSTKLVIHAKYLNRPNSGFFFSEEDLDKVTILSRESHPEYYL